MRSSRRQRWCRINAYLREEGVREAQLCTAQGQGAQLCTGEEAERLSCGEGGPRGQLAGCGSGEAADGLRKRRVRWRLRKQLG